MPEENFADIAAKCRVLLLDIEGTTTSISFVKEKLFPYAETHVRGFLEAGWEEEEVRGAVRALRRLAVTDAEEKLHGVISVPDEDASKEVQIEGLVSSVKWQMSLDRKAGPLKLLQGLIWKQGYDKGDIKGHVYDDVASALKVWRANDSRRVFIYSSGSEQAQRLLFAHSSSGDLLPLLDGHFDTAVGGKLEPASYTNIAGKIDCKPDQILFLTDVLKEAEAAREAGMHAALVSREGNAPLPTDLAFPVITSLADLSANPTPASTAADDTPAATEETSTATEETSTATEKTPTATEGTPTTTEETPTSTEAVTNGASKRKQDEQEEQPAKIAKASADDDVKTKAAESTKSTEAVETAGGMEVDSAPADKATENNEVEADAVKETVVIEEVMEADSAGAEVEPTPDEPSPVAEPAEEKQTENKTEEESKTESIAADTVEKKETITSESSPAQPEQMEAEESPPIITEIEDITDKKSPEEEAEALDLVPIVEEPTESGSSGAAEEELRSAGEVIKECDEVLSKLKNALTEPLLSSIDEEIEAENTDSRPIEETPAETESSTVVSVPETETVQEPTTETKEESNESTPKETTEETAKTEEPASKELPASNGSEEPEKAHMNGDSESKEANNVKHNGDSTNGEERLAENGEGARRLNGNGDEAKESAGAGSDATEAAEAAGAELPEIKVKSVPAADACSEPVEQATDA